ncbi:isopentenyl-diphosphate Delta-isomerase [Arthrobacter mobilis]|uniref:Isopentenyl-diphosphate Delta-isomerase n=1 Tax=Arthrobacter mobilis TaxID=2724944 RepID=A0A7X6K566_9MICC|nr:isopentenyl-diphosphate Delta-isomerase [Arthrobacter mobilis]NKX53093.1 isopentenyl-diphosphate Delta-isomerase [Arthrobacter mobilis]
MNTGNPEQVVLLDDAFHPVGVADKASVHTGDTPLHLAFSCHISDPAGRLLVTRRSLAKKTWPGVWTNSACGHPAPGERLEDAVRRRVRYELGLRLEELQLALPDFRYRAVDASGIVENEFCPVFTALTSDTPDPRPDEVIEYRWVSPSRLRTAVNAAPWAFSPWLVLQLEHLD